MSTEVASPFPPFYDLDGQPLEGGYVWIGVENLYPQTNPQDVYADSALTIPVAQPIRTNAGSAVGNGSPTTLYVAGNYSILVQDKNGAMVYNRASVAPAIGLGSVTTALIADSAVTFVKFQDIASSRILGRTSAGSGEVEELTAGTGLTIAAGALSVATASDTVSGIVELATNAEAALGTDTTRALTTAAFRSANIVLSTAVSASGTSIDFTGIPSWVKRITLTFINVSTNGTNTPIILLGDSGGFETSGYAGVCAVVDGSVPTYGSASSTTSFFFANNSGWNTTWRIRGVVTLEASGSDYWLLSSSLAVTGGTARGAFAGGEKQLSATLDRIRITTAGGTDSYNLGAINIAWE
jgi:hypothetical protein